MAEHTPLPWAYRPYKHDDWGWIRGPAMEGEELGELVAKAHCWTTDEDRDAHRAAKTDPYAANAVLILKAVNNHEALVKALKLARQRISYLGAACSDSRHFEANEATFLPAIDEVLNAVVGQAQLSGGEK